MPSLKWGGPAGGDAVATLDSPTAEVLAKHYPWTERATLYTLVAMLVAIALFVSLMKVERVVTTTGRLVPTTGTLTVQPLQTQIISRVLVSVGDIVKKGQVLAVCDPTFAEADRARLEQQIASLDAQIRRMTAEDKGQNFVPKSNRPYDSLQAQIFAERQAGFRSGTSDLDQRVRSTEAQILGLQQSIADYKSRLKLVGEMESMHSSLAKDGYVSRIQLLNVQDQQMELLQKRAEAESGLAATRHLLESLRQQRKAFVDKWRDENLNALVTAKNAYDVATNEIAKADKNRELVNLVAPADAVVTRVPSISSGGVATGAQPLFNLVPLGGPLEAQIQIDANEVGFVRTGDPVTIKLETFRFLEDGVGKGVVKSISQDSFADAGNTDPAASRGAGMQGKPAYFDARVTVTEMNLRDVPADFKLIPGMTVTADIVIGQRTILWYLVGGGLRSGAEAMREP